MDSQVKFERNDLSLLSVITLKALDTSVKNTILPSGNKEDLYINGAWAERYGFCTLNDVFAALFSMGFTILENWTEKDPTPGLSHTYFYFIFVKDPKNKRGED